MDHEFPEPMLLFWLENSQQEIDEMRQAVCRTELQALWEDVDDAEPGELCCIRQRVQFCA
jgi:hypothetical protein